MELKIKKLTDDAVIPSYANETDAGLDLTATTVHYDKYSGILTYGTGLAVEIPPGHVGLLYPRSSVYKKGIQLANSVGVIDSGYRGEIMFKFRPIDIPGEIRDYNGLNFGQIRLLYNGEGYLQTDIYKPGDRIGQLIVMPYPKMTIKEVDELSDSERGAGGFGSTGS